MPYSDNLYSMVDDDSDVEPIDDVLNQVQYALPVQDQGRFQNVGQNPYMYGGEGSGISHNHRIDEDQGLYDVDTDALSPTDGYFRAAHETATTPSTSPPQVSSFNTPAPSAATAQAPYVPNIWVRDPSLQPGSTAESKAREADQERHANQHLLNTSEAYATDHTFHAAQAQAPRSSYPHSTYTSASSQRGSSSTAGSGSGPNYSRQAAYACQQPSSSSAYNTSSTASYTSYTPRQPVYSGGSHFFTPREAPPAYTPSPTSSSNPSVPGESDLSRNYSTFSGANNTAGTMGGREETEGLLTRDPESMASPGDGLGDETPGWRERMRRRLPYLNWRSAKVFLGVLVLFLVAVGFLTSLFAGGKDEVGKSPNKDPVSKEPITDPNNPPPMDDRPDYPSYPDYPDKNGFQWRSGWSCQSDKISRPTVEFPIPFGADKALTIVQDISRDERIPHSRHVQVQGDVVFRRSESGKPSSSITLEVIVSDDRINVATHWEADRQVLFIAIPGNVPWDETPEGPCVNVLVTVWVPEDGVLDSLEVKTVELGINLFDNLSLGVAKDTKLASTVGKIVSASTGVDSRDDQIFDLGAPDSFRFRSRIIEVKTTSASIKGSWPLLDYLGLVSTSGNIRACIEPKEVDKDKPTPATLYVKSFSGDVELREPIHAAQDAFSVGQAWKQTRPESELDLRPETVLPPRDYRVDVHTTSGNIQGVLAFSAGANFKSTSGNMKLELLPVLDASYAATDTKTSLLQTASTSGNTGVSVLEPLWVDSVQQSYIPFPAPILPIPEPEQEKSEAGSAATASAAALLRSLNSQHTLTSGDMKLNYPSAWEGELSLATNSGRLTAVGDEVEIIKSGKGFPGFNKYILARKGKEGGSRFLAKTTSGDILVTVGG